MLYLKVYARFCCVKTFRFLRSRSINILAGGLQSYMINAIKLQTILREMVTINRLKAIFHWVLAVITNEIQQELHQLIDHNALQALP